MYSHLAISNKAMQSKTSPLLWLQCFSIDVVYGGEQSEIFSIKIVVFVYQITLQQVFNS